MTADIVGGTPTLHRYFTNTLPSIAILNGLLTFNLNFASHRTKEFFVSTANKPLIGTLRQ